MTRALRAPELSAILSLDSCCTTVVPSGLLRALDDCDDAPALGLGERARLFDADGIARLRALLVVGGHGLAPRHLFAVHGMRIAADERDRHGLLHLVAHHHAGPDLPVAPHAVCLSRRMVSSRAMCRRMLRNCSGFSMASVAERNWSRKRSSRSAASCCWSSSVFSSRRSPGFPCLAILPFLPLHELGLEGQLGGRERERFAGQLLLD